MTIDELQKKTVEELRKMVMEERNKFAQLQFDLPAGKVKNVSEIRKTRRNIARVLTVLKQKQ